jgi:hypothetical protein
MNRARAEEVDPSAYYLRTAPLLETASKTYGWLNQVLAVGVGRVTKTGVAYRVYEIKLGAHRAATMRVAFSMLGLHYG